MLLVTAHVKLCHLAYDISTPYGQDRPECDVLIVCRQHNDKQWKFNAQHAKKRGKILRGRKDTLAPVVSTLRGASAPRRSDASDITTTLAAEQSQLKSNGGVWPQVWPQGNSTATGMATGQQYGHHGHVLVSAHVD